MPGPAAWRGARQRRRCSGGSGPRRFARRFLYRDDRSPRALGSRRQGAAALTSSPACFLPCQGEIRAGGLLGYKGIDRLSPSCLSKEKVGLSETPHQRDETTLHLDAVGSKDARFIGLVGRFERDRSAPAPQPLQGDLLIIHQGNDDAAV